MWIQIDVFVCFRIATWIVGDHYMIWCSCSSVCKIPLRTDVNAKMWWICSLFILRIVSALMPVADKWWWHYSVSGWQGIQCDWLTDAIKSSSYIITTSHYEIEYITVVICGLCLSGIFFVYFMLHIFPIKHTWMLRYCTWLSSMAYSVPSHYLH